MRPAYLAQRLSGAIDASGKTRTQIASEAGISKETVTRLANGHENNPSKDVLVGLARATGTTVGYLLGETTDLSPEDARELLRIRNWADGKLPKQHAEPNATVIAWTGQQQGDKVAETASSLSLVPSPFSQRDIRLVVRALGDSMINAGIVDDDTLYAIAAPKEPPIGRLVVCQLSNATYVKRLAVEHGRALLLSDNSNYLPIEVEEDESFEIIGMVVGRLGSLA